MTRETGHRDVIAGRAQEPGNRWPLEARKGKDMDFPPESPEGTQQLILALKARFWTFDLQNWKLIHLCSFKPLSVW